VKVSVEKLPTSEAVLEVELTWDEVEKASDKVYRKLVQKTDVPGFRRGKAPRSLLERRLGKEYIYQEGLDELIAEAYRSAVKEHELTPVAKPELDTPVFEMGQPYHFSLKVPILTPVVLYDYRSLHFEREEVQVTSEEVEQELESLRQQQVAWQVVERPAALDDRVTVDLQLSVEGETISDLKDNPFELAAERHGMFVGIDEQIVGMQAGESKTFTTTLPIDYLNEKLAGKEANYIVTLHKVEAKEVPELDDAFAEKVSNSTLEDLRKSISDRLLESKQRRANDELHEKVVNTVIEQSQIAVHPKLIEEEAEGMLHRFSQILGRQHLSLDQYLKMVRKTREEYLKEMEPDAEKQVKRQLMLDAVADKENIEVTDAELNALFDLYAQIGQNVQRTDAQIRALRAGLRREKALSRLIELTTDSDTDTESTESEAPIDTVEANTESESIEVQEPT